MAILAAQRVITAKDVDAARGCLVRLGKEEPRYATVEEIAARLEPHSDATVLLTAVSEAVERYDPSREAAILLEVTGGYQILILPRLCRSTIRYFKSRIEGEIPRARWFGAEKVAPLCDRGFALLNGAYGRSLQRPSL